MNAHLIILLGSENHPDGRLSIPAISRCDTAISTLQADPVSIVLPTGAFGLHFNRSLRPHGALLSDYLISKGILTDRILPWTCTSGTIEDALAARRVIIAQGASKVTVITSDFHMARTRHIFERIFHGTPISFVAAPTPTADFGLASEQRTEKRKLNRLYAEWVDIPENLTSFPEEIYENASDEQKHYDNLSLAIASGMVVIFSAAYAADLSKSHLGERMSFALAALLILCLLCIYDRACKTARTARRVLRYLEIAYGVPGFSTAYSRAHGAYGIFTIRTFVCVIGIAMALFLGASAILT